MPNEIDQHREEIDAIDRRLVELLNQRARSAHQIGMRKRELQLPVFDPEREKEIFKKLLLQNRGPLPNSSIQAIFRAIIEETRAYEEVSSSGEQEK